MKIPLKRSIALATLLFFVASTALMPHVAHAGISSIITDAALWLPGLLIGKLIMPMMSLLVYLAGMMLNWSVQYSVIDMKANYASVHIDDVWTVMRDLANMGFIFVLLYTSIMTIFGQGKWKDTIVKIVVAALLINFSLFITKGIIDVSNILALLFYNAISPNAASASFGISSSFMDALGIQNLYAATSLIDGTKMAIIGVAGTIIYLISAFTFLAVALMFIIRFMVLLFVVALSPLMFVGSIFPNAGGYAKQWWAALLNQSFFAPVYFMLTWVTLKVSQGLLHGGGDIAGAILGKEVGGVLTADPDAVGTIMRFVIIIGFLVMSLVLAKNMASKSAGGAVKYAMGLAGGATLGGAGKLGRTTFGRAGAALADNDYLKQLKANGGAAGRAARLALAAGEKTSKGSFDLRGSPIGKQLDGGKASGQGGFKKELEDKAKEAVAQAESLKPSEFIIADAEKELKDANELDINTPEAREKWEAEKKARAKEVEKTEKDLQNGIKNNTFPDKIAELQKKADDALKASDRVQTIDGYKTFSQKRAKTRVDELKGVSEDEARKREIIEMRKVSGDNEGEAKKKLKAREAERFNEVQRLIKTGLSEKEANKQAEARGIGFKPKEIKSEATKRKEAYADSFDKLPKDHDEERPFAFFDELQTKLRGNKAAAAAVRRSIKDKKPSEKIADEIAKQAKESKDDETVDAAAPGAPGAAPTPPSTPPPASPTPPPAAPSSPTTP